MGSQGNPQHREPRVSPRRAFLSSAGGSGGAAAPLSIISIIKSLIISMITSIISIIIITGDRQQFASKI